MPKRHRLTQCDSKVFARKCVGLARASRGAVNMKRFGHCLKLIQTKQTEDKRMAFEGMHDSQEKIQKLNVTKLLI